MKSVKIIKPLNNEGVAEAIEALNDFLKSGNCDSKDIVRVTLSVEEALLKLRDSLNDTNNFNIRCMKFLYTNTVTITVSGRNALDLFDSDDSFEIPLNRILSEGSIHTEYSYENGMNKIKLEIKSRTRLSIGQKSLLSLAVGAGLGGLALFLPGTAGADIGEKMISPIFTTFINVVSALAAVMVFLSVTQSIYLIGDKNSFQKIGKKFFKNTLGKMLLLSIVSTLACIPLFHSGTVSSQADLFQIFDIILQIIPTNIITPFSSGSILQILFMAVCLGVTLLLLGSRVTLVKQFIDQCNDIVNHLIEYILQLMPYSIGMSIFTLITGNSLTSLSIIFKMMVVFIVFTLIIALGNVLFTCLRWKRSIPGFLRDTMPVVIMAFTTASSAAALPISMDICDKKLGLDKKLVTFGAPMSMAVFKLGSVIYRVVVVFSLAEIFDVAITPIWLITCMLLCFCLSIAVPAVPGGGLSLLTVLLAQLGIPIEALAIVMACDFIMDRFSTACNCCCGVTELVNIAGELKMTQSKNTK